MVRNTNPNGPAVNGKRVRAFNAAVFNIHGGVCHLCGHPGADTVDHLKPVSRYPALRWDIDNARPAHRSCNSRRKAAAVPDAWGAGW